MYRAQRNVTAAVIRACREAHHAVRFLRTNPTGDNYDFSGFVVIEMVVCIPYAVYVPIGVATDMVLPGLHAASALNELRRWLSA